MENICSTISNQVRMRKIIQEYEITIKKINKKIEELRQKLKVFKEQFHKDPDSVDMDKWNQAKVSLQHLNSMVRDMIYSIHIMEEYLPFEEQTRNNKLCENYSKQILDKRSVVGYVPDGGIKIDNPEDLACNIILQEKLNEIIKTLLSYKQWETLVMYYIYGMTQKEIAKELSIDRSTVAKRLASSIEILRESELLKEYINECK